MKDFTYRKILFITAPLMVGTFVQSLVTFTDAIFVSNLGEVNIGAFGNGSLLYLALFMFSRGLADGTQIIVARLNGEENYSAIGPTLLNSQVYQLLLSIFLFILLLVFAGPIVESISDSAAISAAMRDFLNVRGWGLLFAAQHMALVGFFIGLGRTKIILTSVLIIAICNIFLDYIFINGFGNFEAMGLTGAPLASSISEGIGFLFLLVFLVVRQDMKKYAYVISKAKVKLSDYYQLVKLSLPLMFQGVLSLSTWLVFFTLVEHMGTAALESAHNIRYMYFLAFVPIFGFASSTKTIVSTLVGQKKLANVPRVQNRIILLSILFMIGIFHGGLLYPETLIRMVDQNPAIAPEVLADSVYILKFISGSILIFSVAVIYYNSISGLGKTNISFVIEVIAILLYLIACYFFFIKWEWNIREVWWVEYIYFGTLGICSYAYFTYYRKKHIIHES